MSKIDFQVSVAGQPSTVITVEYEQQELPPGITMPYDIMGFRMQEALDELTKEIGHTDYKVEYWMWLRS